MKPNFLSTTRTKREPAFGAPMNNAGPPRSNRLNALKPSPEFTLEHLSKRAMRPWSYRGTNLTSNLDSAMARVGRVARALTLGFAVALALHRAFARRNSQSLIC